MRRSTKRKLVSFFQTKKRRRLLLGVIGAIQLISIIVTTNNIQNDLILQNNEPYYGSKILFTLPISIIFLIVGFVQYLAEYHKKLDDSIKRAMLANLDDVNKDLIFFMLWGGLLGFSITTLLIVTPMEWVLNLQFVIPPNIVESIVSGMTYIINNGGPEFVIYVLLMPMLGFITFITYKMVCFGTLWKNKKKQEKDTRKVGGISNTVLVIIYLGIVTYFFTLFFGGFDKLEEWKQILFIFLPLISLSLSGVMGMAIFFTKFFDKMLVESGDN